MVCDEFVNNYNFETHLEKIRGIYKQKYQLMNGELEKNLPASISFTHPEGGLFLWGTLPCGADMQAFCKDAVEHNVAVVPGTAFMPNEDTLTRSFRLNYSTPSDEAIVKGCEILGEVAARLIG
jgi:2-aminoadipate transaminase